MNPELEYCTVTHPKVQDGAKLIVAKGLMETFAKKLSLDREFSVHATFTGSELAGTKYRHPLYGRLSEVLIGGDYITTETGTGLVHTAPGHGQEDYLTVCKHLILFRFSSCLLRKNTSCMLSGFEVQSPATFSSK